MGSLRKFAPFTLICFFIGSFAIMGIPFLTGFYSKDLILEFAYSRYLINANFVYFLGLVSAICTSIYSIRIIFLLFSETKIINGFLSIYRNFENNHGESPCLMFISMFCLAFSSIFIGFVTSELFVGFGQDFWGGSITVLPVHFSPFDTEFIHPLIKNLPVILSLLFMFLTYYILYLIQSLSMDINPAKFIFINKFYVYWCKIASFFYYAGYFNTIYNYILNNIVIISYTAIIKYLDKGFFEFFGPFGIHKIFRFFYGFFRFSWYSVISISIFIMFIGICLIFIYICLILSNFFIVFINYPGLIIVSFILLIILHK